MKKKNNPSLNICPRTVIGSVIVTLMVLGIIQTRTMQNIHTVMVNKFELFYFKIIITQIV